MTWWWVSYSEALGSKRMFLPRASIQQSAYSPALLLTGGVLFLGGPVYVQGRGKGSSVRSAAAKAIRDLLKQPRLRKKTFELAVEMLPFSDARSKIERANHHIKDIEACIAALHETNTAVIETDPDSGCETLKHDFTDTSALKEIALILGDAVHNLKCALDYTWLQTIEKLIPANVDDRAKFPVRKTIVEMKGYLTSCKVDVVCPTLFNLMIGKIQPWDAGNIAIWPIHSFDNRDKHRLLIPVLTQGHIDGIEVQDEHGETWPGFGIGDFQLPPYVITFTRGLHVKKKGMLKTCIGVDDEKSGCFMHVPETLVEYSGIIYRVVELFENLL